MIISKTPLRISFVGGGTDNLVDQNFDGNVISTTIDKFVYVGLNKKFDNFLRFSYSKTENVKEINLIKHEMLRETFKYFKITNGLEIISVADIPSSGSGLGSSSSFLVGLINIINYFKNLGLKKKEIAKIACEIEINILKKPIGMQDQYNAVYGGLKWYKFYDKNKVKVNNLNIDKKRILKFNQRLFLVFTGQVRKSEKILAKVQKKSNFNSLQEISKLTKEFKKELISGDLNMLGKLLHQNWLLKKSLSKNTTNSKIDQLYNYGINAGAIGGKLLGAGGGGFLLFFVDNKNQKKFKNKFFNKKIIDFNFYEKGTEIVKI